MSQESKAMDATQLKKMSETLSTDLRRIKEQLDKELKEKEVMKKENEARIAEMEKLRSQVNAVKEEKKQTFSGIIEKDIKPYLESLRKSGESDSRFTSSVDVFEESLNKGLDDAFMSPESMAQLQVVRAAASANQVTSSRLEELFQSQKEWETKFQALQDEKAKLEEQTTISAKELEEQNAAKEKVLEELKKELAELKAVHEKSKTNINNVEAHFKENEQVAKDTSNPIDQTTSSEVAPPVAQTVAATASSKSNFCNGFETLFDFTPRSDWKRNI